MTSRGTSHLKKRFGSRGNGRGDVRPTGVGEIVDERSTVHAIGRLHPSRLNEWGSQQCSVLAGRAFALTGDQGSK